MSERSPSPPGRPPAGTAADVDADIDPGVDPDVATAVPVAPAVDGPAAPDGREADVVTTPRPRRDEGRHGVLAGVVRSGGARLAVLPVSAVLGIVCTRLIIEHYGTAAYAQYGLLVGLINLLPFADLGMSAAIMNAVAASPEPRHDPEVHGVLVTSLRVLTGSMAVFVLAALVLRLADVWPAVLGGGLLPGSGPTVASLCLAVIGVSLTVGFGQRVLSGLGRNHISVLVLGLQTPVMLVVLLVMVGMDLPGGAYLAVIAYAVTGALAALTCVLAARAIAPAVGRAVRAAPHLRTERGGRVAATAWPTLVQLVALPIAMQTDRVVLSHVAPLSELARYNLASQMYTPIGGVVAAAGVALWPVFARARARGTSTVSPQRLALGFGAATAVVCVLIALASPWLAARASDGTIGLGLPLVAAFSALMVCQALKNPLGMYMTDPAGLRYQAWIIPTLLVPLNLGLSIVLGGRYGAVGPVIGSVVAVLLCQVVANWLYVRRDQRRTSSPAIASTG